MIRWFRPDENADSQRRSPLGWPAALFALLLISAAGYCLWQAFSLSPPGGCGMPVAMAVVAAFFLYAVAVGALGLDMLIRSLR